LQTLLQICFKILEIFITTIWGPTTKKPYNAKGKNCYIKTW
jgi:hypothetical protein